MLRAFKQCDLFRKPVSEGRDGNAGSATSPPLVNILRVASLMLIAFLTGTELTSFLSPRMKERFDLDMSETALDAGIQKKIRVILNVTIHGFPCVDVSLDYQDVMGTRVVDVHTTIFKRRLHKNGTAVGETQRNNPKAATKTGPSSPSLFKGAGNASCGSCFGALPEGECCNTCNDVIYAYRLKRWAMPRIEEIEQCKQDGTGKGTYQPPQIIHLDDYSSEDYLPKLPRLRPYSPDGEPPLATPFKFNFSLAPFKPLDGLANFSLRIGGGSEPASESGSMLDDAGDDKDSKPWPECVRSNVVIHGYDYSQALLVDLSQYGATAGCWNNDCTHTDKFNSESKEQCAEMCRRVDACSWWSFGIEGGSSRCWIRSSQTRREIRYGFSSGAKTCFNGSAAGSTAVGAQVSGESTTAPPRRLGGLDDLDDFESRPLYLGFGSSSPYLPIFGSNWDTEEQRLRREQKGESCQLYGYFDTNKVPGNFHIATHGSIVPTYLSFYDDETPAANKNMEHSINHLAFVDIESNESMPNQPLDGFSSPKAFTFQYYLTISPVTSIGANGKAMSFYQFRSSSYVTNELLGPAVFFRLDIDPIRVTRYVEQKRWSRLLVNFCAAVGGCIALSTMLQRLLESLLCSPSD